MPFASYRARLSALRASYTPEKRRAEAHDDLPSYWLYRPLSFYVTPLFEALGMSANAVTVLGILASLLLPLMAAVLQDGAWQVFVGIGLLLQVLDCVDGNLARVSGRSSVAGRMLDGLGSLIFWPCYFIGVGLLAEREHGPVASAGLEIGLGLSVMLLLQRELEDTFDAYFDERVRWEPPTPSALPQALVSRLGRLLEHVCAFGVLSAAAWLGRVQDFLALLAGYQVLLFVLWLARYARAVGQRIRGV